MDELQASTFVAADQATVFETFTGSLDQWWPLRPHSAPPRGPLVVISGTS